MFGIKRNKTKALEWFLFFAAIYLLIEKPIDALYNQPTYFN